MSGLFALLDDVAAIAKVAAGTLDDIGAQAFKAGGKAAGVVIDDAAVTPKYVVGLSPARELPIIGKIALGSLKNKLFILLPAALLLGWLAPWSILPLLALGGLFLCFEGFEKLEHVVQGLRGNKPAHAAQIEPVAITPEELERLRTAGAIRTDFILSAEIMAIAYNVVQDRDFTTQALSLVVVALGITALVYGAVALIVKADDLGAHWARKDGAPWLQTLGRGLLAGMPWLLQGLSLVGMAAMLWVGGGIVLHSIPPAHHALEHWLHHDLHLAGFAYWCAEALIGLMLGVLLGWPIAALVHFIQHRRQGGASAAH